MKHVDKWIKKDFMTQVRRHVLKNSHVNHKPADAFLLLKRHPILCGTVTMMTNVLMQNRGMDLANVGETFK